MPLYDGAHTPAEIDAEIDTLRDELPVVMHLWDEEIDFALCGGYGIRCAYL